MAEPKDKSLYFEEVDIELSQSGRNYLLVIGINAYQQVAKLDNAVRDAQAFRDILLEKYSFTSSCLVEIYDTQATRREIMGTLRKMIEQVGVNDNLLVYFSGHGHFDPAIKEAYWVPVDAQYAEIDDYVSYSFLLKVVAAIKARHIALIVDSCYSGAALVRERDLNAERFERDPSRWILASGRNEVVPDGISGEHSPFADKLLDILARYADEGIRMGTLANKVTTSVVHNSRQTPIGRPLYQVGDQGGEFIFYPKGARAKTDAQLDDKPSSKVIQPRSHALVETPSPATKTFIQRMPVYVWFLIPILLIPLTYLGISQLSGNKETPSTAAMSQPDTTINIVQANPDNAASQRKVLSGKSGLNQLANLNQEAWTEIEQYVAETGFVSPEMEETGQGTLQISKDYVNRDEYLLFLNALFSIGYEGGDWSKAFVLNEQGYQKSDDLAIDDILNNVSWYGAQAYCLWLTKTRGWTIRLPEPDEILTPRKNQVEWCGNDLAMEKGYFTGKQSELVEKRRDPLFRNKIGFRIVMEQ